MRVCTSVHLTTADQSVMKRGDGFMSGTKEMLPRQPFFLNATYHYSKYVVGKMGISHFYAFVADDMDVTALGIPDDCIDIMYRVNPENPDIILCGTGFSPRPLELLKGEYYFGVRFLPGYTPGFHSVSFAEIVTKDILFEELMREKETFDAIIHTRNFETQIAAFLKMYCGKYMVEQTTDTYELKEYLRREILASHGTKKMKQLAEDSGYSDRYITKVFKENYGMTPKRFSEIIKFQYLLQKLQKCGAGQVNFMSVAVNHDYYDESHMLRHFRQYINETPKEFYDFVQSDSYHQKLDIL